MQNNTEGEFTFNSYWLLDISDPVAAEYQAHHHQCVMATIDSTSAAKIVKRNVYRNMDFVPASEFKRKAEISARGYGKPPRRQNNHKFLIYVSQRSWKRSNDPDVKYYEQNPEREKTRTKGRAAPPAEAHCLQGSQASYTTHRTCGYPT